MYTGTPTADCKIPCLYPAADALTNLGDIATGLTSPLPWNRAVILDTSGNFREWLYIYYGQARDFRMAEDVALIRQKLIDWAAADGLYPPYTSVSYPNNGEVLIRNRSVDITWNPANLTGNVKIELYKGGVLNSTVVASAANSGTYSWPIPVGQTVASDYKIRVTPLSFPAQFDESNANFSIRNALTEVTYPDGGEAFNVYNSPNITWNPDGVTGNVKIELYKGGALNSTIIADTANDGSYAWAIPDALAVAGDYKVRVTPLTDATAADSSDANFSIRNPLMAVTYPNGGESVNIGDSPNITWQNDSVPGNAKIELYKGGSLYATIAASTANSGSYSWNVPVSQGYGSDYTVRVTPLTVPSATDESNAAFSVEPARQLFYDEDMSSDPLWSLGTSWAYGQPTGAGQDTHGNPDPLTGYTGNNVIGYRLDGDYEGSIGATRWATTTVINCSSYMSVQLQFQRWLGVEAPSYDHAYIEVSNNGTDWSSVWANTALVDDGAWTLCQYDISATADNQATVYIRWGLGTTDVDWNYCGWNIDDVQLWGMAPHTSNWTPYSWLADNGISSSQEANDILDLDGDGVPTWKEYQAGTDPNDSSSVFCVFDFGQIAGGNKITWFGTTNSGVYSDFIIDRCTDLSSLVWFPVATNSRSASGTNVWTDLNPPATGPVFYRPRLR